MTPTELDAAYVIEPLSRQHERKRFACGKEPLDRYLREQAIQDAKRRVAATFVAVPRGALVVAGYYSLAAMSIDARDFPEEIRRRLPRYDALPAILLGRLARDTTLAGRRIGEYLLMNALSRSLVHSENVASAAVVVDAIDETAAAFYRSYEFTPFPGSPLRLYLPTVSIARHFA